MDMDFSFMEKQYKYGKSENSSAYFMKLELNPIVKIHHFCVNAIPVMDR